MLLTEFKHVQDNLAKRAFRPTSALQLLESETGAKTYRVSGVIQNCIDVNANGRRYRKEIWESQFAEGSVFWRKLKERSVLGMIEHPADGITKLNEVSHVMTEVRFATESEIAASKGDLKEGDILGTLEIIPAGHGLILKALVEANIPFGVSSRGSGTVTESEGCLEVNNDFILETWDAVFSPSVERAIPRLVQEVATNKGFNIGESINRIEAQLPQQERILIQKVQLGEKTYPLYLHNGTFTFEGLTEIGTFKNVTESMAGIEALAEKKRLKLAPTTPTAPAITVQESTTPTMKLHEMRSMRSEVLRLTQIQTGKLKASDKSALFDSVDSLRQQIATIVQEDKTTEPLAAELYERLNKFAAKLDENEEEQLPPPPGNQQGPPPGNQQGPPPGNQQGNPEGCEDCDILLRAAELLRDTAEQNPEAGEEALQTAEELEGVADRISSEDTEIEDGEPFEDIPVPDDIPMEAKRVISRLQRRLSINENRTRRLSSATETLLSEHKKLKSNRAGGERGGIYEGAARKIADRYNADMCSLGREFFKVTQPDLYEANKAKLESAKKWSAFSAITESLMKAKAAATGTPAAPKKVVESTTPPKPATTPPAAPAVVTESVNDHFALTMLKRSRTRS